MFELIRGAVSYLFPGPPRSGVFEADGTQIALARRARSRSDTGGEAARVSELALHVGRSSLGEPRSWTPADLNEPRAGGDLPRESDEADLDFGLAGFLPPAGGEILGVEAPALAEASQAEADPAERALIEASPPAARPPGAGAVEAQVTQVAPALESEPLRLSVPRPRCPFCHEGIAPGALQEACKGCRAWHHEACWHEGRSRCSACGAVAVKQAIHVRVGREAAHPGLDSDLAMSWTVAATGAVAYSLLQIPLRDTYRLHPGTLGHAMTNAWSTIPTLVALSCLFLASTLRPGRWRRALHWVAWGVVALTGILALYAGVFSPPVPWHEEPIFNVW